MFDIFAPIDRLLWNNLILYGVSHHNIIMLITLFFMWWNCNSSFIRSVSNLYTNTTVKEILEIIWEYLYKNKGGKIQNTVN